MAELPFELAWDEVDPARHPFDRDAVRAVVAGLEPASHVPSGSRRRRSRGWETPEKAFRWQRAMTDALVAHYGPWAMGWCWYVDAGGPVRSWGNARFLTGTPKETLDQVAVAVVEWRDWLEETAGRFARFPLRETPPEERREVWERAVVHLITRVVERVAVSDAWDDIVGAVLRWYLTQAGVSEAAAARLAEEAAEGCFRSWVAPAPAVVTKVGRRLVEDLIPLVGEDA